jgi:thiol-disulfide isomerase/thioredoxin
VPIVVAEIEAETFAQALQVAMESDAPLNQRLKSVADALAHFAPEQAEAVERLVTRLKGHHAVALAPAVGERIPGFVLPDENGAIVRLGELLREGPLVINFHRGHWCQYCRLSSISVAEIQDEVAAAGARLVAIVPERASFARQMKATAGGALPVPDRRRQNR